MGTIYRLGLIIAGCYFEGAVRNATQLALYWIGKQDALQGFLPYLIPVFFGYVFAVDARNHWSDNLLKNDVIAYVGSTLLTGYPLLISLSLWFAGPGLDTTTVRIRLASTILLLVNLAIAVFVWRDAVKQGYPLSMPWGGVSRRRVEADADVDAGAQGDAEDAEDADVDADTEASTFAAMFDAGHPDVEPQEQADLQTSEEPEEHDRPETSEEQKTEEGTAG